MQAYLLYLMLLFVLFLLLPTILGYTSCCRCSSSNVSDSDSGAFYLFLPSQLEVHVYIGFRFSNIVNDYVSRKVFTSLCIHPH